VGLPPELLDEVTAHASWAASREASYERLAFVGDSLLSGIVTDHLDRTCPRDRFPAGILSQVRAQVVSDDVLRDVGREVGLDRLAIERAPGEAARQAGSIVASGKPLASMVEALIAACWKPTAYLINTARGQLVDEAALADALASPGDAKSMLQELLAKEGAEVRYETARSGGSEHAPQYRAQVFSEPAGVGLGAGLGSSKKAAEVAAALDALAGLGR